MKRPAKQCAGSGFTLVEITVAIAIFGLTMVVMTQAFVNTLVSLDSLGNQTGSVVAQGAYRDAKVMDAQPSDRIGHVGRIWPACLPCGSARSHFTQSIRRPVHRPRAGADR